MLRPNKLFRKAQRRLLGTITHVKTSKPLLALTFDDGPHPVYTTAVLDLLAHYNAHATFFIVGAAAQEQPKLVHQMAQAGHMLGNHSWDHPSFITLDWRARRQQLKAWERQIGRQPMSLFRPPWGHQNDASRLTLWTEGYQVIAWNISPKDWLWQEPEALAQQLIQSAQPGGIILLHDAIYKSQAAQPQYDRHYMINGLEIALEALSHHFRFVTVPQLIASGRLARKMWYRENKF